MLPRHRLALLSITTCLRFKTYLRLESLVTHLPNANLASYANLTSFANLTNFICIRSLHLSLALFLLEMLSYSYIRLMFFVFSKNCEGRTLIVVITRTVICCRSCLTHFSFRLILAHLIVIVLSFREIRLRNRSRCELVRNRRQLVDFFLFSLHGPFSF